MNPALIFFIFMLIFFVAMALYSMNQNQYAGTRRVQNRRRSADYSGMPRTGQSVTRPQETPEQKRQHLILTALQRAAVDADSLPYQLTDLGILTPEQGQLKIWRDEKIPPDALFMRPFVELTSDHELSLPVILQIVDEQRKTIFRDGDLYTVNGKTAILPRTQLSLKDREINPLHSWSLWVLVDEVPLAIHPLAWEIDLEDDLIRQEVKPDGEISSRLREIFEETDMGEISLNELLSDQQG